MATLTAEQALTFLDAAQEGPHEALYVLALTTGMRQGELLGLKWGDLDLEVRTLRVRRTITRLSGQGWREAEPKSSQSRRSIELVPMAVEALRRHRVRQVEQRLLAGPAWDERGLVFANAVGRPMEAGNLLRRSFWPLLERAGLPRMRFHDLRLIDRFDPVCPRAFQ